MNLIDIAIAIRDLAPWRWLTDSQLIGVRDPETGQVWYCSIMGMLGEYFAVMAYPGEKGLMMLQVSSARDEQPAMHHLLTISGISVDFDDEEYLEPPDFLLFGKLNKCFKGSMAWPKFRDYTAGYFPWFLNANQVTLFTLILSQVLAIAKQSKESASMIPDINITGKIFIHELTRDANDKIEWQDRVTTAPVTRLVKNRYPFLLLNATKDTKPALTTEMETCLDRIRRSRKPRQAIVDVEIVQTEMHCQDSTSRPYFPAVMICIDETRDYVYDTRLLKPDTPASAILVEFISILEKLDFVPESVHVLSRPTMTLLKPITTDLGIKLVQSIHLRTLEKVIGELLENFRDTD